LCQSTKLFGWVKALVVGQFHCNSKNQSKFRTLYNIDGYPRLFLLDNLKTILYRWGGSATEVELEQAFKLMKDSKN
jgi:hypothetical protein